MSMIVDPLVGCRWELAEGVGSRLREAAEGLNLRWLPRVFGWRGRTNKKGQVDK